MPRWSSPWVLLGALAVLASVVTLILVEPPAAVTPAALPTFEGDADASDVQEQTVAALYIVAGNIERIMEADVPAASLTVRLNDTAEALHAELVRQGVWPSDVPAPRIFIVNLGRDATVVLDVMPTLWPLPVELEQDLIASYERTLTEAGAAEVAYLQDGRATGRWLGHLAVNADLSDGARSR